MVWLSFYRGKAISRTPLGLLVTIALAVMCGCGGGGGGGTTASSGPVPPVITDMTPRTGQRYQQITLTGTGFTGATAVTFSGGITAPVCNIVSDATLITAVPTNAQSGSITVTTPQGTSPASAILFTFAPGTPPPPIFRSFAEPSGADGTKVTILGENLFATDTVDFNGVNAVIQILNSSTLTAVIPAGLAPGAVIVTITSKLGVKIPGPTAFTVIDTAQPGPVLTDFNPKTGGPGTRVVVTGQYLMNIGQVTIGGVAASSFIQNSDTQLIVFLAVSKPASGPIVLTSTTSPNSGTHPTPFTVVLSPPQITSFNPQSGPVGTPVDFIGTHIFDLGDVTFNGVKATSFSKVTSTGFTALVPPGATPGPIVVQTDGGSAPPLTPDFQVTPVGSNTLGFQMIGMYLTQATQRLDRSVTLVANRDALLRVFMKANEDNRLAPVVRVTLRDATGAVLLTRDLPGPVAGVPTDIHEGDLTASWNLPIPGDLVQPGNSLLAEMQLIGPITAVIPAIHTYPAGGAPLPIQAQVVPDLGISIYSVNAAGAVGNATAGGRTLESWTARLKKIYPVNNIDLQPGGAFNTSLAIDGTQASLDAVLRQLEAKRLADNPDNLRYYVGAFAGRAGAAVQGISDFPFALPPLNRNRSALVYDVDGLPDGENYGEVMAHELGHTMGRFHSGCGIGIEDPEWPYGPGEIGAWGYDMETGQSLDPAVWHDIMGYCVNAWCSDYFWKGVMVQRATDPQATTPAVPLAHSGESLLVWGSILNGVATLQPAFQIPGATTANPAPGPYSLDLLDAAGGVLGTVAFDAQSSDRSVGTRSFHLLIPMTAALQGGLASLRVSTAGRPLGTARSSALRTLVQGQVTEAAALGRNPVAVPWGPGTVHLGWDAGSHPMVMVKDPMTGEVIGMGEGGSLDLLTGARELDLILSDGVRSRTQRITVN